MSYVQPDIVVPKRGRRSVGLELARDLNEAEALVQGPRVDPVSERCHGTLDGAEKQISVPIKPIGDLRGQSADEPEPSPSSGPHLLLIDPPEPAAGSSKRVRSFRNDHNRDLSHPDAPGNAGIGVQQTVETPAYTSPEYDCAVNGPPPLDHSPMYYCNYCLIIPAAEKAILAIYCK